MYKTNKEKLLMIIALVVGIASLSVGFAAFSTTLNISSSASVNPNSDNFKVRFSTNRDSLVESAIVPSSISSGVKASNATINNTFNPTISNLNATLTLPGQHVEYTFYARNEGEYTAYLNSINYMGEVVCEAVGDTSAELVEAACQSIKLYVTIDTTRYSETTERQNSPLEKGASQTIRIRVNYQSNASMADGDFRVSFPDIMLVYSTIDDSSYMPTYGTANMSGTLNSKMKALAANTDEDIDFSGWDGNSGVFIRKGTENHVNPIYYYRGEVDNNNVLFAGKCWKIVRTTETGGTKLIYNGMPTSDNKCNGDNSMIGKSTFNDNYSTEADVSYIYSDGTNSTIKQAVDTWYTLNMTSYTDMLEDTVWCNDRSISSANGNNTFFGAYARNAENKIPSLHCSAEYSLTTSATSASNKLTYPVGLLTADELTLAGMGWRGYTESGYLNNYDCWWTLSPNGFGYGPASVFHGNEYGGLSSLHVYIEYGVRPAISLKAGTMVTRGDGTAATPYIIE